MSNFTNSKGPLGDFWRWVFPVQTFEVESSQSISDLEERLQAITRPELLGLPDRRKEFCGHVGEGQFQIVWMPFMQGFSGQFFRGNFFASNDKTKISIEVEPHGLVRAVSYGFIIMPCIVAILLFVSSGIPGVTKSPDFGFGEWYLLTTCILMPPFSILLSSFLYRFGLEPSRRALMKTLGASVSLAS